MLSAEQEQADVSKIGYNLERVAKLCDVSTWTVRNAIRQGRLKAFKFGGKWLVAPEDLKAYIEGQQAAVAQ